MEQLLRDKVSLLAYLNKIHLTLGVIKCKFSEFCNCEVAKY